MSKKNKKKRQSERVEILDVKPLWCMRLNNQLTISSTRRFLISFLGRKIWVPENSHYLRGLDLDSWIEARRFR